MNCIVHGFEVVNTKWEMHNEVLWKYGQCPLCAEKNVWIGMEDFA